jgi:acetoacetate decarboxylase
MGFVKTREELDRYFGLGNRKFIGAKMIGVMFQTRPEITSRLLPPPLELADAPTGTIFIAEYPDTNLGPGYNEAAIYLRCRYRDEIGSYCLSMPITREGRMHNGRNVFGLPKKLADDIRVHREGNRAHGWAERKGIRIIDIKIDLTTTLPQLPPLAPSFTFKASPRIDLTPGFDGPVLLCSQKTDIDMRSCEIGEAVVEMQESVEDPWHEVEIEKVLVAYYLITDNTMQPGRVLAEVDPDGYLPHYYKMTDFYYG